MIEERLIQEIQNEHLLDMKKIVDLSDYNTNDVVVDLGCGLGESTMLIAQKGVRRVIGVDPSEKGLEKASNNLKSLLNVELKQGYGEELSRIVTDVDKIVAVNIFSALKDVDLVFMEVYKCLKRGGKFLFNNYEGGKDADYKSLQDAFDLLNKRRHIGKLYSWKDLERMAVKRGFSVEKEEHEPDICGPQYLTFCKQYIQSFDNPDSALKERINNLIENLAKQDKIIIGMRSYICLVKN